MVTEKSLKFLAEIFARIDALGILLLAALTSTSAPTAAPGVAPADVMNIPRELFRFPPRGLPLRGAADFGFVTSKRV